jgi:hypothetical protein
MSEAAVAAPAASPAEAPGSGVSVIPSLEERSAAAFDLMESAGEAGTPPGNPADAASPAGSIEPDAAAKARADRRAALDKLQAEERGRVDAMAAIRERDELRKKLTEASEQAKAYATHVDPSKLTKEQFFALAEKNPELTPTELGEWLRERMANPELAAANAATRAVDPKISALEKKIADQQAMLDSFVQSQTAAQEQAVERQAAEQFFSFTRENAGMAPYSARFLEKHGPDQFIKLAHRAVQDVPPHAGPQAILDEIEENLTQLGAIYSAAPAPPQRRQANQPPSNSAAAQAPTHVTNTLAQQRSSVVDEDADWASLPFEERSARAFR